MEAQLYKRIQTDIRNKIINGTFRQGEKLPTENELIKEYGVSKMTVRNALFNLERAGFIYAVERVGNFVATPVTDRYRLIFSDVSSLRAIDGEKLIKRYFVKRGEFENTKNPFGSGKRVLKIEKLLYSGDIPVAYDVKTISYEEGFSLSLYENAAESFVDFITRYFNAYSIKQKLTIEAIRATKATAELLKVEDNSVAARITRRYYSEGDKLFAISETVSRPEYIEFSAHSV